MKETQVAIPPDHSPSPPPDIDNEISLVDIWLILRKHRKIMLITFGAIIVLGLLAILLLPKKYEILTALEIGTAIDGSNVKSIESAETVMAKLNSSFIPALKNEFSERDHSPETYNITVTIPKNSSLVVLRSKASKRYEGIYQEFHSALVNAITNDHAKLINVLKKGMQAELARATIELDRLADTTTLEEKKKKMENELQTALSDLQTVKDPNIFAAKEQEKENSIRQEQLILSSLVDEAGVIKTKLAHIDSNQELIRKQINELEAQIAETLTLQKKAHEGITNETRAMAQLLINNDIQQNRNLMSELKERLYITLEDERAETQKAADENKRQQAFQEEKIKEAAAGLQELLEVNKLDQLKASALIAEIEAQIANLINEQKRQIEEQRQTVGEIETKLENFVETRAVVPPTRSLEPVSFSKTAILLLSICFGLALSILASILAEFRDNINKAIAGEEEAVDSK